MQFALPLFGKINYLTTSYELQLPMNYNFPIIYWSNKATKVQFQIFNETPAVNQVTACMVCVVKDNSILLSKPQRGWGLPGGHLEHNESPQDCAIREVREETNVEILDLELIGGWKAEKIKEIELNKRYPEVSYQLLFFAKPSKINEFIPTEEILERKFVNLDQIQKYHHDFDKFSEILKYVVNQYL